METSFWKIKADKNNLYLRCQTGCVHSKHSTTALISLSYFKVNSATLSVYLSLSKFQLRLDKNMSVLWLQTVISSHCCPAVRLRSRLCPRSCCGHSVVAVYPIVFILPRCSCSEPTIAVLPPALGRRCRTVTRYSHLMTGWVKTGWKMWHVGSVPPDRSGVRGA